MGRKLGGLLAGGLLFRALIAYFLPAGFDEAYYFLYQQHLDWSYFDHPAAVALTTGLGIWLTGLVTPFTLRLGALVLFTASLWLLYATGEKLFGQKVGFLSCAIASLAPLFFFSFGILAAPDNALIFFWSLALYLCTQEFFDDSDSSYKPTCRLALISVAIALCCLSKYHGFLLGLSLVGFCLGRAKYRVALVSKAFWLGCGLFALMMFPLLYWNAQHEWISFQFQLGDRFAEYGDDSSQYSVGALAGVVLAQLGYLFPSIALPLWWVTGKAVFNQVQDRLVSYRTSKQFKPERAPNDDKISFLLWTGLPVGLGFTLIGGATHTFPAWPAPGLWSLTLLLGYAASQWRTVTIKRWLQTTGWIVGTLLLFALTHITLGTLQKPGDYSLFGGFVSAAADPSTQMIDTVQLRDRLMESAEFEEAIAHTDFIITSKYWLSGYLAMSMPSGVDLPVGSFTSDPRGHAFWFSPEDWIGKDALFVSVEYLNSEEELEAIAPYFQNITLLTKIATQRGGEVSETFYFYRAQNLLKPYPYPY